MINFPDSPTVGQLFQVGPQSWNWDGKKWLASGTAVQPPLSTGANRIINGDMRIDQRNNGASGTANGYTVDRWAYSSSQTAKGNWQRNPNQGTLAAFPYGLLFVSASAYTPLATDYFQLYQIIEADMVSDFAWGTPNAQPVTLSFWAYSTLAGTFSGSVNNNNTGTPRAYPFTFNIPTASTWTQVIITIPGDTAGTWAMSGNAGAISLAFDLGSGANYRSAANVWTSASLTGVTGAVRVVSTNNAQFLITGVKLEIGNVATPFNRKSLSETIADCQRYFTVLPNIMSYGYNVASSGGWNQDYTLPVQMRAAPTLGPSNITNSANATSLTVTAPAGTSGASFRMTYAITTTGAAWVSATISCAAEL
jgi:hypothetical protein